MRRPYFTITCPRYMLIPQVNGTVPGFRGVKAMTVSWPGTSVRVSPSVGNWTTSPQPDASLRRKVSSTGRPALTRIVVGA